MTDTANLRIKVDSSDVKQADKDLDRLEKQGAKTERATDKFGKAFARLAAPIALVAGAVGTLSRGLEATSRLQDLEDQLVTATGSASLATVELERLDQISREISPTFDEVTQSFVKLKNLGLDPSREAIISYGNVAAAMGKQLDQLIEAVADAATGEFERLKEFGIKSKSEGENVTFTFQGVETTVRKSSTAIQGYLLDLGNTTFAGALERKSDNLSTAFGNLGDATDRFTRKLASESGLASATVFATNKLADFLNLLSGAPRAVDEISEEIDRLREKLIEDKGGFFGSGKESLQSEIDELEGELARAQLVAGGRENLLASEKRFNEELEKLQAERDEFQGKFGEQSGGVQLLNKRIAEVENLRDVTIDSMIEVELARVTANTRAFEARQKERAEEQAEEDKLRSKAEEKNKAAAKRAADVLKEQRKREFESVEASLRSEEESITASFERRQAIIQSNTKKDSELRAELLEKNKDLRKRAEEELKESRLAELHSAIDFLQTEEDALKESYERRRDIILSSTEITLEEKAALEKALDEKIARDNRAREAADRVVAIHAREDLFGSLSDIAREFAGEQSGIFKGLFAASKAFAIADSIIAIQQAIALAGKAEFPRNLVQMGIVASQTAGIVSTIQGTNLQLAGAFDQGGMIPAGSVGIAGEFGPELISGPAVVQSRAATADKIRQSGPPTHTTVVNNNVTFDFSNADESVIPRLREAAEEIMEIMKDEIIRDGQERGPMSIALKQG